LLSVPRTSLDQTGGLAAPLSDPSALALVDQIGG
jgi:hypothetical protein